MPRTLPLWVPVEVIGFVLGFMLWCWLGGVVEVWVGARRWQCSRIPHFIKTFLWWALCKQKSVLDAGFCGMLLWRKYGKNCDFPIRGCLGVWGILLSLAKQSVSVIQYSPFHSLFWEQCAYSLVSFWLFFGFWSTPLGGTQSNLRVNRNISPKAPSLNRRRTLYLMSLPPSLSYFGFNKWVRTRPHMDW